VKNFDYYSESNIPYFGYEQQKAYGEVLKAKINNTPMTADARSLALSNLKRDCTVHASEQNKEYYLKSAELLNEFWADARQELGYAKFLNPELCQIVESKAWENGHSNGFQDVFSCLEELVDFAKQVAEQTQAAKIYETLSSQPFADWYDGKFVEHISDSTGPSKDEILTDIKKHFKV
jgi:hypothetical protein